MGSPIDDCADLEEILIAHQKTLKLLEVQAASYTTSTIPVHLKQQLDEKRQDVENLKVQLEAAQLAKKKTPQPAEIPQPTANGTNRPSRMRSLVPDEYYIERDEAERLLKRFAIALKEPDKQPLLFNIYGIGGVGKTTLLGRLQQAHMGEVDFLEVCFAKTSNIETPLKLMGKLYQQARQLVSGQTIADAFTQQEQQFEKALSQLSQSVDGKTTNSENARKITRWFEQFVWLSPTGFTASKPKSLDSSGSGFSAFSAIANDTEGLQEWIQQQVPKLTQAFAESLIQIAQSTGRVLVLILDTYEKAQAYLNQWLWQYLVEDTPLYSAPVRLVVVGRKSLQADEGWRKLNQDRKLLHEVQLNKFSKKQTGEYLQQIGITKGHEHNKIYKVTQGLPYYLNWVREKRDKGETLDFSQGNQAIAKLLLQGINTQQQKILQVVACCRWFNLGMLQYLSAHDGLSLQQDAQKIEDYFEWLKSSDFVEFSKGQYRLDDVARDVFRQSYFHNDHKQFRDTNDLLANYFKQQADKLFPSQTILADLYEDEEWRELIAEFLYYNLFSKGRERLAQYIEQVFVAIYLKKPDVFIAPFSFISAEMNTETRELLPTATSKFFKNVGIALCVGWLFLYKSPTSYKIEVEVENTSSEEALKALFKQIEASSQSLLGYVGDLEDGFGKGVGLICKALRCHSSKEKTDVLLQAKNQVEQHLAHCHPKLAYCLFSRIGSLLISTESYEDSLHCYQKALELGGDNTLLFFCQGLALVMLGRYEEALDSVQAWVSLDPKSAAAWIIRGYVLIFLDRYEEALKSYETAINLDSESVDSWVTKGKVLVVLKRYEEALKSYETAINLDSESVDSWVNRGDALFNLKRYEEALKSYETAINLDSESVNAWKSQGNALFDLKQYEEALKSYETAINLDSESVDSWVNRGDALFNLKRHEEALKSYETAINLDSESVNAWKSQGNALFNLQRDEEALKSYQKVIELDPQSVKAWVNRVAVLFNLERYEEALKSYQKAFELDPKFVYTWSVNQRNTLNNLLRYVMRNHLKVCKKRLTSILNLFMLGG